jgi:hypothetical protein
MKNILDLVLLGMSAAHPVLAPNRCVPLEMAGRLFGVHLCAVQA